MHTVWNAAIDISHNKISINTSRWFTLKIFMRAYKAHTKRHSGNQQNIKSSRQKFSCNNDYLPIMSIWLRTTDPIQWMDVLLGKIYIIWVLNSNLSIIQLNPYLFHKKWLQKNPRFDIWIYWRKSSHSGDHNDLGQPLLQNFIVTQWS